MSAAANAKRPSFDKVIQQIADYVLNFDAKSCDFAMERARYCLFDSLGCAMLALAYPACTRLMGPVVPGAVLENGARVPGTAYVLDPVQAAFNIGAAVRWLDYNDTWLAQEWGHPSDNLAAILSCADYQSRQQIATAKAPISMQCVLATMIKAHEIQGALALENSFNRVGLDHVLLVRIASAAVATQLLGGDRAQIVNAISQAWIDGNSLRAYRHAPNTGSRKSWAAGDASARGVRLALLSLADEMGYPSALSADIWGMQAVCMRGKEIALPNKLGTYVMENVLFKASFPAEFHAQSAIEAAIVLQPQIKDRIADISRIVIETQEPAMRIINKTGPLHNPADRDHCLQYMVAVALLKGDVCAEDYEDAAASDPMIDTLRALTEVVENKDFSRDYLDANKRSIANAIQVFYNDGQCSEQVRVDYPIGHVRRWLECVPALQHKLQHSLATSFNDAVCQQLIILSQDHAGLCAMSVDDFMALWVRL